MTKSISTVLLLVFTLIGCNRNASKWDQESQVVLFDSLSKNKEVQYDYGDTIKVSRTYVCKDIAPFPDFGSATIKLIHEDTLEIINSSNNGYSGETIRILLDRDLRIQEIGYQKWTDDGSYAIHTIVDTGFVNLNKNPFLKGLDGISGNYSFLLKDEGYATEYYFEQGVEPHTFYFDYYVDFICK